MKTLIAGASGATGQELVNQLLLAGRSVKIVVRSTAKVPEYWRNNNQITFIEASILDLSKEKMAEHLIDCDSVASCLGHNITLKGMFGKPRRLVLDSVKLLCDAIQLNSREKPIKFVLMNTAGNSNRDLSEPISRFQKILVRMMRVLLPPHADNEQAADYLRMEIGQSNTFIEWSAVRPDALINLEEVTEYEAHSSPIRSAIFNAGKTSRINVANFMTKLITESDVWAKWKGQMPVIYNVSDESTKNA